MAPSNFSLSGKKIVLGLTGGIACYKAAELVRLLVQANVQVQVVMTQAAEHFITPMTMQGLSGRLVYTEQWDSRISNNMAHIDLTREADGIVIAPCSADFMFKLAQGAADDLLSTLCLARPAHLPLLIAPAMNVEMWQNPATQRNFLQIKKDGIKVLGPVAGSQACGETGLGRMLEPELIMQEMEAVFQPQVLAGKRVLITAGSTFEPIDPVRGLTNLSSGKMGYAIARAARAAGATVHLISGPTMLAAPYDVSRFSVQTAQQMQAAVMKQIAGQDVFIAVAAVSDWRVENINAQKLKKYSANETASASGLELKFTLNPDILAEVAALPNPPYCVGFAAESENLLQYGAEKRRSKNIPLLVGNIGTHTFGQDQNEIVLFDEESYSHWPRADKNELASQLVIEIARRLSC